MQPGQADVAERVGLDRLRDLQQIPRSLRRGGARPGDEGPLGGGDGIVSTDLGGYDITYSLALMPDGRVVATGHRRHDYDLAVLRYEQIRSLDNRARLDDFVADGGTGEEIRARLRLMSLEEREAAAVGELEVDEDRYEVRVGGAIVDLTFKEFELLRFLVSRPGKVFTREVLLEQVWGYDYFGGARTVDVHVRRIRAKIEREGHAYIRTIRGVGYIFEHRCMD